MRPIRLDLQGFASYTGSETFDFTDVDFFALTGPTGAGKSTVLDAMCFALYGRTPRWRVNTTQNAIAPSAVEGRVRLVFAAAGQHYVATRILRRDRNGKVKTTTAALEQLPDGVDPADDGELVEGLGKALAGSPNEVSNAAERVIGLPFEQFTKCVLLPQGEFAEFLHASPADRRKILENLLGHSVYRRVQQLAGAKRDAATTAMKTLEAQLARIPAVTDLELTAAAERVERLEKLTEPVRDKANALDGLAAAVETARRRLNEAEANLASLTYIKQPAGVADIAAQVAAASAAVAEKAAEVEATETEDERLRSELDGLDLGLIERQLKAWAELAETESKLKTGQELTEELRAQYAEAKELEEAASEEVEIQHATLHKVRMAELAGTLRAGLAIGDECPVCDRPVDAVPEHDLSESMQQAEEASRNATVEFRDAQAAVVALQTKLENYEERLTELQLAQRRLKKKLEGVPEAAALEQRRSDSEEARQQLAGTGAALKAARRALREAEKRKAVADERQQRAWKEFQHARDQVAVLGPPAGGDDLAASWSHLVEWAAASLERASAEREAARTELAGLDGRAATLRTELRATLGDFEIEVPRSGTGGDYVGRHAAAVESARAASARLAEARRHRIDLESDMRKYQSEAEIAKALASHLEARRFMEWLLSEALDELVAGATVMLNRITGGQYDLIYRDQDFWVVDHHDADMARPARSLSGGETFAASLSLALALSDQLASLARHGASLESIILDEGFGTLDPETLDAVASTLEALTLSARRTVGLVTHVAELAERVPVRFHITKDAKGSHVEKTWS
ncbi:SMC family ATPase [Glycomyces sp. TRM65418]|uniref:AAA family ATPase n=1 Tax=Glycomyces sp. TRM65418 TaxID=2867006 RepID=UPI001CE60485|nr:SMC family ATPase [Glycomyces sp. TRM65418]MCC3762254.1 SMC family ATPase [Glycomyces sp. TRM65418]QZD56311.1 SMC family ATPase [Glycomyces sp. TRM65418]